MFVANGANWEAMKERLAGMWSEGRGPFAAKFERFRAVMTERIVRRLPVVSNG